MVQSALAEHRLHAYHQPNVVLGDNGLFASEVLTRIHSPSDGVEPIDLEKQLFLFDDAAALVDGEILQQSLDHLARLHGLGMERLQVSVNVSAASLCRRTYAEQLTAALAAKGISPSSVTIEIVETVNVEAHRKAIWDLHDIGVRIALDDFGTGYANLFHLKRLPVDFVKIDRRFISRICSDSSDRAIIDALIGLTKTLGIQSIAEGIETAEQAALLRDMGCDIGQGYFFGKAMPFEAWRDLVATWNPLRFKESP